MNEWFKQPCRSINQRARELAQTRQDSLTKPPGSLGELEQIAITLAGLQEVEKPNVDNIFISIFAADHGVANAGVSAFPQAVTGEMVRNFARGGAAISVLAKSLGASLEIVNVGTASEVEALPNVIDARIAAGTNNLMDQPAMSYEQMAAALAAGRDSVGRAKQQNANLFIGGDMGIANTTSASAIACALLEIAPSDMAGPGTGLDKDGVAHKATVIDAALKKHTDKEPLAVLQNLGGFEIAALTGAYINAAQQGIACLVDGFIASAAALVAIRINPGVSDWMMGSHQSAEPGHRAILMAIGASNPLLKIGMRLGEGSGAAVAASLLKLACQLHANMATFAEAGVSKKSET